MSIFLVILFNSPLNKLYKFISVVSGESSHFVWNKFHSLFISLSLFIVFCIFGKAMTSLYLVRPASAGRRTSPTHRFGDASEIFLFFQIAVCLGDFWVQVISHSVWSLRLLGYDPDRWARHSLNMISGVLVCWIVL